MDFLEIFEDSIFSFCFMVFWGFVVEVVEWLINWEYLFMLKIFGIFILIKRYWIVLIFFNFVSFKVVC